MPRRRTARCRLNTPSSATLMLFLLGRADSSIMRRLNQDAALAQRRCIHRDLVRRDDHQKIRLALRHHGAEDALAKAHIAGDRAAALAHPMQLALLHVQAGAEGNVGQDVGGLQHALPAQSGDHHVSRFWLLIAPLVLADRAGRQQTIRGGQSRRKAPACPGTS